MSWLFGKKKTKESKESSEEASSSNQGDDYIIIEKQTNPFAPDVSPNGIPPSESGGLYPFLGGGGAGGPGPLPYMPGNVTPTHNVSNEMQSYLSGVPFQLDKRFENNVEIERLQIDEIQAFLLRTKSADYDYDFGLEKSVIAEMEASSE